MNLCIVNALWYLLVGESLELEDEKMKNLLENFDAVLRSNKRPSKTIQLLGKIHPGIIKWFDSEFKLFRKLFDQTENLIRPYINEHKASLNPNELRDFMDAYLNEVSKTSDKKSSFFGKRGEESLISTITDLFFAGTETTTSSLLWAILCLLHFPEVQEKVQAELDHVVGDRKVSLDDKANLPYTNAVLMESMRIATIVPMALPHCATEDMEIAGFHVPKNAIIFPDILNVHYDPEYFKNADTFDPNRFYDEDTNTFKPNERLIPFSIGRRFCLGQSLAEKEYFLFFTSLLQKFKFGMAPGLGLPPIGRDVSIMVGIIRGAPLFDVIMKERSISHQS